MIIARPNQLLIDHLREVGELMMERAMELRLTSPLIPMVGLYHDLLKARPEWQTYLQKRINKIPTDILYHTEGIQEFVDDPFIIAMIMGHHSSFQKPLSRQTYKPCPQKKEIVKFLKEHNLPMRITGNLEGDALTLRMIFSLLIDADRQSASGKFAQRFNIRELHEQFFKKYYERFGHPEKPIDEERLKFFEDAKRMGEKGKGIYELFGGTGLGKTLAGMGFSLTHSVTNNLERIIIVPPFKAIIENASKVYREYINNILVHHSDVLGQIEDEEEIEQYKHDRATWCNPIIVTTAVQLFYSLFSNRPTPVRKLNRIANSLIVIDEPQLLPDGYLEPLMGTLKKLVKDWNCSVLFTTATPSFYPIKCNDKIERYIKRRTEIVKWEGNINLSDIVIKFKEKRQGLLVVRSKKDCEIAYNYLSDKLENVEWIRGDFCHEHRQEILIRTAQKLKEGKEIYLVGTQLIEAGVDLDFRVGFAQQCSLHSLVQIAGRVGRNNLFDAVLYYGQIEDFVNESMFKDDKNYQNNQIKNNYTDVILKGNGDIEDKVRKYNKIVGKKVNYDILNIQEDEDKKRLQEVNDKIKWIDEQHEQKCPLCSL